jgi:hypothetical protein
MNKRLIVLVGITLAAALARLLPHEPNVTPIAAMALFGGACFRNRKLAYLLPLAAMLLSDLVLGLTRYDLLRLLAIQPVVYACFLVTTAFGRLVTDRRSVLQVGGAMLAGSILFYVVTNFAVWAGGEMSNLYPLTPSGLATCYVAAIPYFRNSLAGDFGYTLILFGGLAVLENRVAWMREGVAKATASA